MKCRTIILVALFCFISSSLQAQSNHSFLKPLAFVDGLMSKGRISAAGRSQTIADPFAVDAGLIRVSPAYGTTSISKDYDFIMYLDESNLHEDALTLICSDLYQPSDTLSFLRGWTFYRTKHLTDAAGYFSEVSSSSVFYDQAVFFGVASDAHLHDFSSAQARLAAYSGPYTDIKNLQSAGLSLLQGRLDEYEIAAAGIGEGHYAVTEAAQDLSSLAEMMRSYKPKSPVIAGIGSALVPGLGKIYAGRLGEGVMSFLTVGAFGAMTAENWIKCGATDWKTILFGTLGTICYISNIYGSCIAVKVTNQNTIRGYETAVLMDIHIPLYSIFR